MKTRCNFLYAREFEYFDKVPRFLLIRFIIEIQLRVVEYSNTLVYSIGVKCGYSTTLGKYAWIPHYSWEICRYSSTIKPKFLTAILRLMEQVYFILLPVRTCIRICIPGVKAVIHSIP